MISFEVMPSSLGGNTLFTSFSSACNTNSSTDEYPHASAHCLTLSSNSPSIFTLCDPNIPSPDLTISHGLKNGLPNHTLRLRDSKLTQNGRCDVGQCRQARRNLPVAQQNAGNQRVIH